MSISNLVVGKIGWETIVAIRDAFISKVITTISLTAFLLSNFDYFLNGFGQGSSLPKLVLFGAFLFILGTVFAHVLSPPEFRSGRRIPEIISQMLQVTTINFLISRVGLLEKLIERMDSNTALDCPDAVLLNAKLSLKNIQLAKCDADKLIHAGSLYDADLKLRQYEKLPLRLVCGSFFFAGGLLIAFPTLRNLIGVLSGN